MISYERNMEISNNCFVNKEVSPSPDISVLQIFEMPWEMFVNDYEYSVFPPFPLLSSLHKTKLSNFRLYTLAFGLAVETKIYES